MSTYSIFNLFKSSYESFEFWMEKISATTGVIFRGTNNIMTNIMPSHIHLYEE